MRLGDLTLPGTPDEWADRMGLILPEASRKTKKDPKPEEELSGFELLNPVLKLLRKLRDESDAKRKFHLDHLASLLLLGYFNPVLETQRGLRAATELPKVRRKLGIPRASQGSLSAAQHAFDADLLAEAFRELLGSLPVDKGDARLRDLKKIVTIADGTLLRALPRMAWALWLPGGKNAAKAHVQFEPLKGLPCFVDVTEGKGPEREAFRERLEAGRLYVMDCGYAAFALFQAVIDAGSNFVVRLPAGWSYEVLEERPLTELDREARVVRDVVVNLGSSRASSALKQPLRIVEIERVDEPSKRMRSERGVRDTIVLVTDRLDLPADLIAHLYASRWQIEIFFRWLKCTIGCKHPIFESPNGVALQLYCALLACFPIGLWTGRKPTKRIYEAFCLHLQGLADLEDVMAIAKTLPAHELPA